MSKYSDLAVPVPMGASPGAERALGILRATFMSPSAPSPEMNVEQHMRNGADVVAGLMLDRSSGQIFQQSIDAWIASGGLTPFEPPIALPPRQTAQLHRRMAALVAQSKAKLPFANAPKNAQDAGMPLSPVTKEPSRDRIHSRARTDLAAYISGLGSQQIVKSDGSAPPKGVQAACKRGLELAPEYGGSGLTEGAKSRARSMAAGNLVTDEQLARMSSFFARHSSYEKTADPPSPGYVSWLLWGGDAGKNWADSKAGEAEKSGEPAWKKKGYVGPGGAWATAKRKAKGKGEAYARKIYSSMIGKSGGAGSRGGHVIGTTKSGKPIYAAGHAHYTKAHDIAGQNYDSGSTDTDMAHAVHDSYRQGSQHMTREDHLDASELHDRRSGEGGVSSTHSANASRAHASAAMMYRSKTQKSAFKSSKERRMGPQRILTSFLKSSGNKTGEGSRGGHVIGHYKNGSPIYASGDRGLKGVKYHPSNSNFENRGLSWSEAKEHAKEFLPKKHTSDMHISAANAHRDAARSLDDSDPRHRLHLRAALYHEHAS